MATSQVNNSGSAVTMRPAVYTRWRWSDSWNYQPYWTAINASQSAGGQIGSATFKIHYGSGRWENGQVMADGGRLNSYTYCYVQIRGQIASRQTVLLASRQTVLWTGLIPAEKFRLLGQAGNKKTADQTIQAYGLDYLLGSRLDGAWVKPAAGGSAVKLNILPTFNQRHEYGGSIIGNRSSSWDSVAKSFVFADEGAVWTNLEIIDYLLQHHQASNGPKFICRYTTAVTAALMSIKGVYDFNSMTLYQALNILINRGRGFGWMYRVSGNTVELVPFSLLDTAIRMAGYTIPANTSRSSIELWQNKLQTTVDVTGDIAGTYDKIIVRGGRMKAACSLSFTGGSLEKAWTSALETQFKDASKNSSGYSGLDDTQKALRNDLYRATDKFERCYTTFRVPNDWDWKAGGHIVNPLINTAGTIQSTKQAAYWNVDKRLLNYLPFKVGWDYSGTPESKNPSDSEPEFRAMFCLVKDKNGKYCYAEKYRYIESDMVVRFAGMVRPLQREFGVSVRFNPAYLAAKGHFAAAEPGGLTEENLADAGIDYEDFIVTAMVETDQYVQVSHQFGYYENMRVLTIELTDAEIWYCTPGTVWDVDDNGAVKTTGTSAEARLLRDDRERLKAALAAAVAWYGRQRNKIEISVAAIDPAVPIGTMLTGADVAGTGARGSVVTNISWDFVNLTTAINTDYSELDIAAIFSGSSGSGSNSSGIVTNRKLAEVTKDVRELKTQAGRSPLRIETGSGGGGTGIHIAYCKTNAGSGDSIQCYLDTDLTGEVINVHCEIYGGAVDLDLCTPPLVIGTPIYVISKDGEWHCINPHFEPACVSTASCEEE